MSDVESTVAINDDIPLQGLCQLLNEMVDITDEDGNPVNLDPEYLSNMDDANISGMVATALNNIQTAHTSLLEYEERDAQANTTDTPSGDSDEEEAGDSDEEEAAFSYGDALNSLFYLLGELAETAGVATTVNIEAAPEENIEASLELFVDLKEQFSENKPDSGENYAEPLKQILLHLVEVAATDSIEHGINTDEDKLLDNIEPAFDLITRFKQILFAVRELEDTDQPDETAAEASSKRSLPELLLRQILERLVLMTNHDSIQLEYDTTDIDLDADPADNHLHMIKIIEEVENYCFTLRDRIRISELEARSDKSPEEDAIQLRVEEHLAQLPTKTGMTVAQIEQLVEERTANYREKAELKYAEYFVSVDGSPPFIIASKRSGRYLTCDFKSKPKIEDWRPTKSFEKAHWFASLRETKSLIKKLAKNKFKGAKRLEARRIRLIAPD